MSSTDHTETFDGRESGNDARGKERSFDLDSIYRLHAADVSRWLRRISGEDDVSDLLHEVFVVAHRRAADFRGDASARTFLYAISLRVVAGWRRKTRLRQLFFLETKRGEPPVEPVDTNTPFSAVAAKRATEAVRRVLDRLSDRDRALIVLFELEGEGAGEIGAIVGLTPNGVWVALHRARKRFKEVFVDLYGSKE